VRIRIPLVVAAAEDPDALPRSPGANGKRGEDTYVGVPVSLAVATEAPTSPPPRMGTRRLATNVERSEIASPPTRREGPAFA